MMRDIRDIEEILKAGRMQIEQLEVPEELEIRLRNSLNKKRAPLYKRFKLQIVALVIMFAVITLNYDVIASYSRQLLGYEQVMNGTLKELSELGKGQFIGESFTFDDGLTVTVDYVMLDGNQLLLFYTVKDPRGDVESIDLSSFMKLEGRKKYWHHSSVGYINDDETEINYIASFEPPSFYDNNLSLSFSYEVEGESLDGEINFKLDRQKAMGYTLKKNLNKKVRLDETTLVFKSILASPTKTVIEGSLQSILGLAFDTLNKERFRPQGIDIRLIANGEEVEQLGSGLSTDMKGINFHVNFDALPSDLKDLKLELVSFSSDHDVYSEFELESSEKQILEVLGQEIEINEIEVKDKETFITITSEESLVLTKVYLMIDGEKVSLEETMDSKYIKQENGKIKHTRTLRFLDSGNDLRLNIERMTYSKDYNEVIEIPIE